MAGGRWTVREVSLQYGQHGDRVACFHLAVVYFAAVLAYLRDFRNSSRFAMSWSVTAFSMPSGISDTLLPRISSI